jgi:hypothetical protein
MNRTEYYLGGILEFHQRLFSENVFLNSNSCRRGRQNGFYEYEDPSHGFQGDMTAEEIFNMFFGGGMPGSSGTFPGIAKPDR